MRTRNSTASASTSSLTVPSTCASATSGASRWRNTWYDSSMAAATSGSRRAVTYASSRSASASDSGSAVRVATAVMRSATRSTSGPTRAVRADWVTIASRSRSFFDRKRPYTAPVDSPDSRTMSMIFVPSYPWRANTAAAARNSRSRRASAPAGAPSSIGAETSVTPEE